MFIKLFSSLREEKELQKEAKFRKQIYELETEIAALHEAIALIRAALKNSSQREEFWREKLQDFYPKEVENSREYQIIDDPISKTNLSEKKATPQKNSPEEIKENTTKNYREDEEQKEQKSDELGNLAFQAWRDQKLSIYTFRSLYHQLIELKRRFLHNWYQILLLELDSFPENRRKSLKALLENSVDGALSVGVQLLESQQTELLENFLKKIKKPTTEGEPF